MGPSETSSCSTSIPGWGSQGLKTSPKVLFLNLDPLNWWSNPESIAWVWIHGESSWTFMDIGSTINAVTPEFIEVHSLDVGHLSNLSDSTLGINSFGGVFFWPLGYCHHKGSGGRSLGLQWRSSSPSHTRLYWLWILSTSYYKYTHHQSDHQCNQGKWNQWVVGFPEWIKNSPFVGLLASRTSDSEENYHKPKSGSDQLEWGGQNNKEGRDGCFFIQINT